VITIDTILWQGSLQDNLPDIVSLGSHQRKQPPTESQGSPLQRFEVLISSLDDRQRERLVTLTQMNPERRLKALQPSDRDFSLLNECLTLNPERLRTLLWTTRKSSPK